MADAYVAARLVACAMAFLLLAWTGIEPHDLVLLLYGPLSTPCSPPRRSCAARPSRGRSTSRPRSRSCSSPADWRSPYYMLWLAALALPAAYLPLRQRRLAGGRRADRVPARRDLGRPGAGAPGGDLDRDARDPRRAAGDARRRPRLRARHAAPALRRALGARAAGDRGRAPPDRVGAARLRQAAPARRAPARELVERARRRVLRADRLARRGRARVRRLGHGHEPRRAALAAGGPPARGGAARPRRRARARRHAGDHRPRPRARAAAADRRARLPDRRPRRSPTRCATPTRRRSTSRIDADGDVLRAAHHRRRPRAAGASAARAPTGSSRWRAARPRSARPWSFSRRRAPAAPRSNCTYPSTRTEPDHDPRRRHR